MVTKQQCHTYLFVNVIPVYWTMNQLWYSYCFYCSLAIFKWVYLGIYGVLVRHDLCPGRNCSQDEIQVGLWKMCTDFMLIGWLLIYLYEYKYISLRCTVYTPCVFHQQMSFIWRSERTKGVILFSDQLDLLLEQGEEMDIFIALSYYNQNRQSTTVLLNLYVIIENIGQ